MTDTLTTDEKALAMRRRGSSFVTIAKRLGLGGVANANAAFNRALRALPAEGQQEIRDEELARLDALEARVKADTDVAPFDRDRRLDTIGHLRKRLLAT